MRFTAFESTVNHLLSGEVQTATVNDLIGQMGALLVGTGLAPYTRQYLKLKLEECFGDVLFVSHCEVLPNIYSTPETAMKMLRKLHYKDVTDSDVTSVASHIRKEVASVAPNLPTLQQSPAFT